MYVMKHCKTLYETDIFYYLRQTYKINVQNTKNENTIRAEVFSVLLNFPSVTMLDAINLLLENVLNGEYAQRLADIIYVIDFDFDEPIAVHIRHSKRFPVAG